MKKLVILDRDGVINQDSDTFIKSPDEWVPISGSLAAISRLKSAGWIIAIATNQSGLARGLLDISTLNAIHAKMRKQLADYNANVDYIAYCPHLPSDGCNCRKPNTGMYEEIASFFKCSLIDVPVIGDSARDLQAAVAVGARPILVRTGKGLLTLAGNDFPLSTCIYSNLYAAVQDLLKLSA